MLKALSFQAILLPTITRYLHAVHYLLSYILLLCLSGAATGQGITVCGIVGDALCTGMVNTVQLEFEGCENSKVELFPNTRFEREGCVLHIHPQVDHDQYSIIVTHPDESIDSITMLVKEGNVDLALIIKEGLMASKATVEISVAQGLEGIAIMSECLCLRGKCVVRGYRLILMRNGQGIYWEDINSASLSNRATEALDKVQRGDTIYFEDIRVTCPGDDGPFNGGYDSIVINVK